MVGYPSEYDLEYPPVLTLLPDSWTWDLGYSPKTWDLRYSSPPQLLTTGGHHWRPVQTCSLENIPPPVLIDLPSSGHWNTYDWQAGSTHSTGMLSYSVKLHYAN